MLTLIGENVNFHIVNKKALSSFSLAIFFQISVQPQRIRINRNHQNFMLMQGYLSEIELE